MSSPVGGQVWELPITHLSVWNHIYTGSSKGTASPCCTCPEQNGGVRVGCLVFVDKIHFESGSWHKGRNVSGMRLTKVDVTLIVN